MNDQAETTDTFDKSNHPGYKEVSVAEILDAMERNGIEKGYNAFFSNEFGPIPLAADVTQYPITEACALGQAAINLEVDAEELYEFLNSLSESGSWGDTVAKINDESDKTISAIAIEMKTKLPFYLERKRFLRVQKYPTVERII